MFDWYRRARVCYVHMADVGPRSPEAAELQVADIRKSAWFSRGWTLQELLAPYRVEFCTNDWQVIGTKTDEPFLQLLHEITQIPLPALRDPRLVTEYSVAQRMSWAASRRTTRTEDQAYCLLGLFQVNMALLYGEGARAFHRLQREILAQNDDESIFAWTVDRYMVATSLGVLADSPRDFAGSGEIVRTHRTLQPPSVTTNKGLSFTPRTAFHHDHLSEEVWIVYLECGTLKERKKVKDAGLTGSFHRRDVHQSTIALTREQQAQLLTQEEWREGMAASKRLGGSDAALIVGMRTKHQPSFYRVYANSLSRQDMTESLPRGKGRLALNRSFYLRV